jgi:hypothetical protein
VRRVAVTAGNAMTDYYPLIARAVAGLEKNTGDQRRALYERARTALVAQLRGLDPPLNESEITRERLALEESIRKVEAEAARKARFDAPRIDPVTVTRPFEPPKRDEKPLASLFPPPSSSPAREPPAREVPVRDTPARDVPSPARDSASAVRDAASELREALSRSRDAGAPPPREPSAAKREPADRPSKDQPPRRNFLPDPPTDLAEPRRPEPPPDTAAPRSSGRGRTRPPPLTDQGLKGFSDVVAEAETLGEATAYAARSAREAYAAVPSDDPELDRMEPRLEPAGLRSPLREPLPARGPEPTVRMAEERVARQADAPRGAESRPPRPMSARHVSVLGEERPQRSSAAVVVALVAVLAIVSIAGAAYWYRESINGWFAAARLPFQGQAEQSPGRPKFPDRVGQPGQTEQAAAAPAAPAGKNVLAAVAQKVVLYEEDPADPQGKRFVGSAVWHTDTVSPGSGQPPEMAIRADLEVPERNLKATMSIRRNTDQALEASHTIELMFNIPADFPFGGISNVPTVLMKQAEQARGAPLAALVVKVSSTFFIVGLQSGEGEAQHNIQLLKERPWFDIPIVYANGRRAILAVEKGTPGERAFDEAFKAWGQ